MAFVFGDQDFLAALDRELFGLVVEQNVDAFSAKTLSNQFGNLRVFTHQQARRHFHLRHFGAKSGEGLRQLRADWAAAENDEARG